MHAQARITPGITRALRSILCQQPLPCGACRHKVCGLQLFPVGTLPGWFWGGQLETVGSCRLFFVSFPEQAEVCAASYTILRAVPYSAQESKAQELALT